MDLADLLVDSPATEPQGILERTRDDWPLNEKASSVTVPDGSDRVRLRQVISTLDDWGIQVSGVENSQYAPDAPVSFSGSFYQSGDLKGQTLTVTLSDEHLEPVQIALQGSGFAAVVSHSGRLLVRSGHMEDEMVEWMELDQLRPVKDMTPQRFAEWIETCPMLTSPPAVRSLDGAGLEPQEANPWLELQSDPDEDGETSSLLIDQVSHIPSWAKSGMNPQEAREWIVADRYHFRSFRSVEEWIKAGWSCQEAMAWINLMRWSTGPDEVKELQQKGYTVKHALKMKQAGISSWEFNRMNEAGLTPAETVAWLESGVGSVESMREFTALSLDGKTLRRWNRAAEKGGRKNPLKPAEIKVWSEAGRSFDQAEPWLSLHHSFIDLSLVEEWEEAGLRAADADGWAKAGVPELSRVKEWKAVSPSCADPVLVGGLVAQAITPAQAEAVLTSLS